MTETDVSEVVKATEELKRIHNAQSSRKSGVTLSSGKSGSGGSSIASSRRNSELGRGRVQPAVANARRTSAVRVPAKAKRTTARQVRARAAAGDGAAAGDSADSAPLKLI